MFAGLRVYPYHSDYSTGLPHPSLLFHTLRFQLYYIFLQDELQIL